MIKIEWLKDIDTGRDIMYLNISNILSALRFSLVPLLITMFGLLTNNESKYKLRLIIFIFAVLVSLTDFFDGILARKLKQVTKIGIILDPIGDFLLIICVSVLLILHNIINIWYFILIMIRIPGLIIIAIILMIFNIKYEVKTSILGKTTIFYTLCLLGLGIVKLLLYINNYYFNMMLIILQIIGSVIIIVSSIEKIKLLIFFMKNQKKVKS